MSSRIVRIQAASTLSQQVYEQIPDEVQLDVRISSPVIVVPHLLVSLHSLNPSLALDSCPGHVRVARVLKQKLEKALLGFSSEVPVEDLGSARFSSSLDHYGQKTQPSHRVILPVHRSAHKATCIAHRHTVTETERQTDRHTARVRQTDTYIYIYMYLYN